MMNNNYYLNGEGNFVIENFQKQKTFSSFLSGIAGQLGIPLWVFYVNRGQGIASFGLKDKNKAIMEFYPANKAYQNTPRQGFRTFIKKQEENKTNYYEPFSTLNQNIKSKMIIEPEVLTIEEENTASGLKVRVQYFIIPNENFGGLVRKLSLHNISGVQQKLEILDGMPFIIPGGIDYNTLKNISQTISAWAKVNCVEQKTPFYRLRASSEDDSEVQTRQDGNFYMAFGGRNNEKNILEPLVDPRIIFEQKKDFSDPEGFFKQKLAGYNGKQIKENQIPSAMTAVEMKISPGGKDYVYSVYGYLADEKRLPELKTKFEQPGYFNDKLNELRKVHKYYLDNIAAVCGEKKLEAYTRQTFLDNILRGGFPVDLGEKKRRINHLFSRKHGDLERDYNFFELEPTYFARGNGNYRDINQNRRSDLFFNPEVKEHNIKTFVNLIQADGFNPLEIAGQKYILEDGEFVKDMVSNKSCPKLIERLEKPFTPGELAVFIEDNDIVVKKDLTEFIKSVVARADFWTEAVHGEGFWIDHWTYILDLIENYRAIYPDKIKKLLTDDSYIFYDNYIKVLPRKKKYVLTTKGPRQYNALTEVTKKKEMINSRARFPHQMRTENGQGEIYQTSLLVKLVTLIVNKMASLDPEGMGLEMEAGKPGWYDALNGLPGLFGSSISETMELLRLIKMLEQLSQEIEEIDKKLQVPEELYKFYKKVNSQLQSWKQDRDDFSYWQYTTAEKEKYRNNVFYGFSGEQETIPLDELKHFFHEANQKLTVAVKRARRDRGLYDMYFSYEMTDYKKTGACDAQGREFLKAKEFKQHRLPLFLEAQVKGLKISNDSKQAARIHKEVKKSELFDRKLNMYRVNGDLSEESHEIGRARAFSPGWLENGSIWLHMEYKYILELLKNDLYDEFYQSFDRALVPFLDPKQYGRSTLENSSFILSSLNSDTENHGRGYIARLSGSTAEYLQMWSILCFGSRPFRKKQDRLIFKPEPVLRKDLFTKKERQITIQTTQNRVQEYTIPKKSFAFRFLGQTLVIYTNPGLKDTFGENKAVPVSYELLTKEGATHLCEEQYISGKWARKIRNGAIEKITIKLA